MKSTIIPAQLNKEAVGFHADKQELVVLIKREVQEVFGRSVVAARDCIQLSEEIFLKTSFKVNANTLRRFFGLVRTDYLPSFGTLNILAQYCGFENYEDLKFFKQVQTSDGNFAARELLNYFISLFRYLPVKEYNDEIFVILMKHTILLLQLHPQFTYQFQRAVAKTKNGQNYYFEQFAHIDGLNSLFGKGLRFYLNEKKTTEAQIFGHSLLCVKAWLSDDADRCRKHYEEVMKYKLGKTIRPFVYGRYFASQLYFAEMYGLNVEKVLINAQQVHAAMKMAKENYRFFPFFEHALSIALLLTGYYEEALYYSDYGLQNCKNHYEYEAGFHQSLGLVKAVALLKCRKKAEALEMFKTFHPSAFYFLTKKANTIIYLCLKKGLQGLGNKDEEQLNQLIHEVGFIRITKHL